MDTLATFAASIQYLEDLAARPIVSWKQAGLDRMIALFESIDNPQLRIPAIQVAGTAGKGSTTTMAAAILHAAGTSTGTFTSPHLQSYRERIAFNGTAVDEQTWLWAIRLVQPIVERMARHELPHYTLGRPAFLEVLWAMASLIFVEQQAGCVVVETGVGGRVDPTTVNAAPVAVITNVSLDHTDRLGTTVEAIAAEKAGLIKSGQIIVTAAEGNALSVIREKCRAQKAVLWRVSESEGEGIQSPNENTILLRPEGQSPDAPLTIITPRNTYHGLRLRLQGTHQRRNAACAVAAVEALATHQHLPVSREAVATGLANAVIPGRMELLEGRPSILLDGAKGPAAAAALATALSTIYANRRVVLILGVLSHKDIEAMTAALCPRADVVIVAEPPWAQHAALAEQVAQHARRYCSHVELAPEVALALDRARTLAGPDDLIVTAGSLILVGAVRSILATSRETQQAPW